MGRKKQWWLALVVAAVVAVGGGTWWFIDARRTDSGQGTSAGAATSVAQPVTLGTVSRTVSVSGTFTPTHVANLNFGSGGTVTAVTATVGEKVTAGEKLATIDATSLKAEVTADQASLTYLNQAKAISEDYRDKLAPGWGPVRVLMAAQEHVGEQALLPLYTAMGERIHLGKEGITPEMATAALAELGSRPARGKGPIDDHSSDALLAAAWLRRIAPLPEYWSPEGMTPAIAATEGWTFGAL